MNGKKKERKEYQLEEFLEDTEKELEELEKMGSFLDSENAMAEIRASETMREHFLTSEEEAVDFPTDGYMEITVTDDEMEAYADFYPPSEGRSPLNSDDAAEIIERKNLVHGVRWDDVNDALFRCNTERIAVENVLIAVGIKPLNEVPAYYSIEETLLKTPGAIDTEAHRVEFREVSPFVLVKKGDVLARLVPKQEGKFGSTVFGEAVPYGKEEIASPKPGKNTKRENGTVVAACDGRFEVEGDEFHVNEVLQIDGDVDYSTGNIDFPGDVILTGHVKDGFKLESGGTIYCGKTLDASNVTGQKDLIVKQGIIGRKQGSIKVEGEIQAKFIENCYVEAGGMIRLEVGTINSALYTSERVELGKKGVIVGGTVYAQNGVTANQIGTALGPRTEIYCGIDYTVSNKMEWIRDNTVKLAFKLKQIEERMKTDASNRDNLLDMREKIKKTIYKLNNSTQSLIYKLEKNDNAEVTVRGTIFPGVYIEICHVSYVVGREMTHVRFKLDKEKGRVVSEKLMG